MEDGTNPSEFLMSSEADIVNGVISLYSGTLDTKLVVISKYSGMYVPKKIGQGYVPDINGEYIRDDDGNYVHAPNVSGAKWRKQGAFEGHDEIIEVYFANDSQISIIGEDAFKNCRNLRKIVIPSSVKLIESGAFEGCERLEEVIFADDCSDVVIEGATAERSGAFGNCVSLRAIRLPKGIKDLGDGAFKGCTNLVDIYVESATPIVLQSDGDATMRQPFEMVDGMVIHIPNKSISNYEEQWKDYKEYLREEEAQDAENENEDENT